MFDPANLSEPFKRFLVVIFGEFEWTEAMIREGVDVSPLYQLSAQERRLAEDLMIEHLEKGGENTRVVIGLGALQAPRAIPFMIKLLLRTDLDWTLRIDAAIQLRNFPCQQVVQALEEALYDKEKLIRHHAASSLLAIYKVQERLPELIPIDDVTSKVDLTKARQALSIRVMSPDLRTREAAIAQILALCKHQSLPRCEEVE